MVVSVPALLGESERPLGYSPPEAHVDVPESPFPSGGPGVDEWDIVGLNGAGVCRGSSDQSGEVEGVPRARRGGWAGCVVVLLPALNEARGLACVLDRIPTERLRGLGYDVSVWVVDGKSTDGTLDVARGRGVEVFVQTGNGKGNGVRQALDHLVKAPNDAKDHVPRMFVMLDADGSYPPERIPDFVASLESGFDVTVGSRLSGQVEEGAITPLNRLGNRLLSRLAAILFGVPMTDVCTGMWAFREDALRDLGLSAEGFDLEADLFASCCEARARLQELPIEYRRRVGEPKLIPLRTGLLIAWRLLIRRLQPRGDAVRPTVRPTARFAEEGA